MKREIAMFPLTFILSQEWRGRGEEFAMTTGWKPVLTRLYHRQDACGTSAQDDKKVIAQTYKCIGSG